MYDKATICPIILSRVEDGMSLRAVCRAEDMPTFETVKAWLNQDKEFSTQYARAMLVRADSKFEELEDVSEQAADAENAVRVQGLRLKADNIKWMIARMNPKKYGDKLDLNHGGAVKYEKIERVVIGADPDT
jgi:hypothetical protein